MKPDLVCGEHWQIILVCFAFFEMTDVGSDRTSAPHFLKVSSQTGQDASGSQGAQTRSEGAEELCHCRGQWPKPTSSLYPGCQLMSTPLLALLLNSLAQTSRPDPFLNLSFFSDSSLPKGHRELPCVYESCDTWHRPEDGVTDSSTSGLPVTCFCCPPCLLWKPLLGFWRRLIFSSNGSLF